MNPLLACQGLNVAYEHVQVLFDVNVTIEHGEILALLGPNGAGKTTLVSTISGLLRPTSGSIVFDGADITRENARGRAARGIVHVPSGRDGIFPTLTVAEHLRCASWLLDSEDGASPAERADVLTVFPVLSNRLGQMAGDLSGGEQQMLTLAMAFIARPKLLMIDELTLGLAPVVIRQLLDTVRLIHEAGTTVLLVEQSVNTALTIADRAYFLEKGEIRFTESASELLRREDLVRGAFLGAGAAARRGAPESAPRTGGAVETESALEVEGLVKHFGGVTAVSDVSFSLHAREILGLIGPNGAGKTTVLDLISGFSRADGGTVHLGRHDMSRWSPDRRARAGLGRSFQDSRIFPSLSVSENIAVALERHLPVRDHLAAILHLPEVGEMEEDVAWAVADLLDLLDLRPYRHVLAGDLSMGTRRLVDLAMALAHEPSVLLLDEPSSGVAQRETDHLRELLYRIRDELGCAMVVIEHDMSLITAVSDRMIALELGAVIAKGPPDTVVSHPRVVSAYLGGSLDSALVGGSS
ncbi:MAG: ATP-binding cassette domain-containing protein [Actinomycetota bacterium]